MTGLDEYTGYKRKINPHLEEDRREFIIRKIMIKHDCNREEVMKFLSLTEK